MTIRYGFEGYSASAKPHTLNTILVVNGVMEEKLKRRFEARGAIFVQSNQLLLFSLLVELEGIWMPIDSPEDVRYEVEAFARYIGRPGIICRALQDSLTLYLNTVLCGEVFPDLPFETDRRHIQPMTQSILKTGTERSRYKQLGLPPLTKYIRRNWIRGMNPEDQSERLWKMVLLAGYPIKYEQFSKTFNIVLIQGSNPH